MFNFLYQSDLIHRLKTHNGTENKDEILAQEFKYHMEKEHRQNGAIDQGR